VINESAYITAEKFAREHYENFPVVSVFIKKELRKHIAIIYWFARTADDIADEGNLPDEQKIRMLDDFQYRLTSLLKGNFANDFEVALNNTITSRNLSPQLFYDLIAAFRQDLIKKRYESFKELLDYCKLSANPVGRLILELHGIRNEEAFYYSDMICSALQLINFYQDVKIDYSNGRIYFPIDEMDRFRVTENMFELNQNSLNLQKLVNFNVNRAANILDEGKNLLKYLPGRLKFEIRWTILGGNEILNKIRKNKFDIFIRPKLLKSDFLRLLLKSIV
jgi:squalene synthase HpnC